MQGAWRCIVRLDQFCLAGGAIFVPCALSFFGPGMAHLCQRNSGLEFSLQAALTLSRLKPVLHARYGVQPSGCADFEQAKACTPCEIVGYFNVVGMEFSLQAALTLSRLKPELQTRWLSGVGKLLIYDLGKSIGGLRA